MLTRRDARGRRGERGGGDDGGNVVATTARQPRRLPRLAPLAHNEHDTRRQPLTTTASPSAAVALLHREAHALSPSPRVPLSLQLEAYIRKEHRLQTTDGGGGGGRDATAALQRRCASTLHIFREVLGVLADRFPEYGSVLYATRDAYEAALHEAQHANSGARRAAHGGGADDDNGDRSAAVTTAVARVQERANATISNLQAQLHAAQSLAHSLREQLAAAEHANQCLQLDLANAQRECAACEQRVTLLARAMIDEGARTAQYVDEARSLAREVALLQGHNALLRSDKTELLQQHHARGSSSTASRNSLSVAIVAADETRRDSDAVARAHASARPCAYSDAYVHSLLARLDARDADKAATPVTHVCTAVCTPVVCTSSGDGGSVMAASPSTATTEERLCERDVRVLASWLRDEGACVDDVADATTALLPPGLCAHEELAFLRACAPVRNRHLRLVDVLRLLDMFWAYCEDAAATRVLTASIAEATSATDVSGMRARLLAWLRVQSGHDEATAQELGVNVLVACQHHLHHPECHALLAVLRGFLPSALVLTWRRALRELRTRCSDDAVSLSYATRAASASNDDVQQRCNTATATAAAAGAAARARSARSRRMAVATVLSHVRGVFPEKSRAHMLQLRCYLYRLALQQDQQHDDDNNVDMATRTVALSALFDDDNAYFAVLLKRQLLREVEAHTLAVVERVRRAGDAHRSVVSVRQLHRVLSELEPHMSSDARVRLVAECCQRSILDARCAEGDDGVTVRLDALLTRLRCSVLLRRVTPPDDDDDDNNDSRAIAATDTCT